MPHWSEGVRCRLYHYRTGAHPGSWLWVSPDTMSLLGNPDRLLVQVEGNRRFVLVPSHSGNKVYLANNGHRPTVWAATLSSMPAGVYAGDVKTGKISFDWESEGNGTPVQRRATLDVILVDAVRESGGTALMVPRQTENPRLLLVRYRDLQLPVWAYVAMITHGGGQSQAKDEGRIQLTGLTSPLEQNPYGPTLLMGYDQDLKVFAAWEFARHRIFHGKSPSVQIHQRTLVEAVDQGMAVQKKGNGELAIAIRADEFLAYCLNAAEIHESGSDERAVDLLERATRMGEIRPAELEEVPPSRRRVVQSIARYTRLATFRTQVLQAYDRRCAVTRWQMNFVEAAHILPVAIGETSIDHVRNGLALSPTYHQAFDQGLIYLTTKHVMMLNVALARDLERHGLGSGLEAFATPLGKIHLPPDNAQWPDPEFIFKANEHRGII